MLGCFAIHCPRPKTMSRARLEFDHVHLLSANPHQAADWYETMLDAELVREVVIRNAPQINLRAGGMTLLIRGARPGEDPGEPASMQHFDDFSSHNTLGTDHFGFTLHGDLLEYCARLRKKGAEFVVEPWEFMPGAWICYLSAPDGVSIEIVQAR